MSNRTQFRSLIHPTSNTFPPTIILFTGMTRDDDGLMHLYGHGSLRNPTGVFWDLMQTTIYLPPQVTIVGVVVTILPPGRIPEPSLWDITKARAKRGHEIFKTLKPKVHIPRWHGIWWN